MVTLFRTALAATRERCAELRENREDGIETIEIVIWAAIIGAFLIILGVSVAVIGPAARNGLFWFLV